jgi:putative membrane protein
MSVEIDTAGSAKKELKIHALSKTVAVDLALELSSHLETKQKTEEEIKQEAPAEKQILKLSKRDLLKIGISQNHFKTAAIIFLFGFQFFNQLKDNFEEKTEEYAKEAWTILSQSGIAVIGFLIVFFILISFLYSMIRTLVLFYDLRFIKLNLSYRIVSGLLNRKNILVPFRKIQQIDWETGPIKKIFGIYRVNIRQATSELATKTKLIEIPGCLLSHIELLKEDLFGSDKLKEQPVINSSKVYFRRNWLYFGWLPAILISPVFLFGWIYVVPILLWIFLMYFHSKLTLKKSYFQINNDQIRVSSGAISHKFKQMEFHKVQHLEYRQSIFHKKRGVASLKIGNAAGFIMIPYIDEKIAKSVYDYLLYYSETSEEYWM